MSARTPAILVLKDGTVFRGTSIGAAGITVGEVVFNTAMTGYQEILTDPSYCRQIVTLTYPHIGNYGINVEDVEASKVHAAGLIIRDLPLLASNFRSSQSLSDYLKAENVVAIAGIDTRKLTRILREKGAQNGAIVALPAGQEITDAIKATATLSTAVLLSLGALGGTASAMEARDATETFGRLTALNNSGVEGSAEAIVFGRKVIIDVDARKTVKGMPGAWAKALSAPPPRPRIASGMRVRA